MSQNSSDKSALPKRKYRWHFALLLPLWVLAGFVASQFFVTGALMAMRNLGASFEGANPVVLNTIVAAAIYILTLVIVLGMPWWFKRRRTTKEDLGVARVPSWLDISLAPAGFIVYFILSALLVYLAGLLIPAFDMQEAQNVGFSNLTERYEVALAFFTLVIVAPLAEELLFRGYLYGKLRRSVPMWVAILMTSIVFAVVHGQWNVAIDVFALSLVMCGLREITGSIWSGVILHTIKNALAFYLLFINPSLLATIGL